MLTLWSQMQEFQQELETLVSTECGMWSQWKLSFNKKGFVDVIYITNNHPCKRQNIVPMPVESGKIYEYNLEKEVKHNPIQQTTLRL